MTTRAINREDPRYSRMHCDCCTRLVGWLRGAYPFFLCDDHAAMADDDLDRAFFENAGDPT